MHVWCEMTSQGRLLASCRGGRDFSDPGPSAAFSTIPAAWLKLFSFSSPVWEATEGVSQHVQGSSGERPSKKQRPQTSSRSGEGNCSGHAKMPVIAGLAEV